ncbi:cryptochrome/photolyase family protein [uncultured Mesonia sp.]|uniref:cryptochrome/photolyase family protein n=1 Tax=uncultured Mesonia sp. TaxID=399731 RepID=UPI00374E7893
MSKELNLFWFRRDLRLDDNKGLLEALKSDYPVLPIFIFDSQILSELPKQDPRVTFIYERLQTMRSVLQDEYGSSIAIFYGEPVTIFKQIVKEYDVKQVFTNRDYELYAISRDKKIAELLQDHKIEFITHKDQVIFEKEEIVKDNGEPYLVYTPYMKKWRSAFKEAMAEPFYTSSFTSNYYKNSRLPNLSLSDIGFEKSSISFPEYDVTPTTLNEYSENRDLPAKRATSNLSPHLRFGSVGLRKIIKKALQAKDDFFLKELIWREFFMQILYHFPETATNAFKKKYDNIAWRNNEEEFKKWKEGKTGYPIVDAGMRQLNQTGLMHNRVRMVVGSFLCKHLLIDWRWGEAYFAEKLLDYEMASNVGNWQWVAGCGVDAAPYFRIFNPHSQLEKFDKDKNYIKKWIPELETESYISPIVEHKEARERCLKVYKAAVQK